MTSDTLIDPELRGDRYLYHSTQLDNIHSILRHGIQPSTDGHRDGLEDDLVTIADKHGFDLPISRQDCVFFYVFPDQATRLTSFKSDDTDMHGLNRADGLVVIDGSQISGDMYVGEFQLISDAIDHQYMSEPDDVMISESYNEALRLYAESLTRIESFSELGQVCAPFHLPEVVVENGVAPTVIVDSVT